LGIKLTGENFEMQNTEKRIHCKRKYRKYRKEYEKTFEIRRKGRQEEKSEVINYLIRQNDEKRIHETEIF
jgi:hypothetical protein